LDSKERWLKMLQDVNGRSLRVLNGRWPSSKYRSRATDAPHLDRFGRGNATEGSISAQSFALSVTWTLFCEEISPIFGRVAHSAKMATHRDVADGTRHRPLLEFGCYGIASRSVACALATQLPKIATCTHRSYPGFIMMKGENC
jgi:hypothetical protein